MITSPFPLSHVYPLCRHTAPIGPPVATTHSWCVQDLIGAGARVAITGNSEMGQTLLALDLSLSVATGRPAVGHFAVTQSPVLYVPAVGPCPAGRASAIQAWCRKHGVGPSDLADWVVSPCPICLHDLKQTARGIEQLQQCLCQRLAGRRLGLIVVDDPAADQGALHHLQQASGCAMVFAREASRPQCGCRSSKIQPVDAVLRVDAALTRKAHRVAKRRVMLRTLGPTAVQLELTRCRTDVGPNGEGECLWPTRRRLSSTGRARSYLVESASATSSRCQPAAGPAGIGYNRVQSDTGQM